MNKMITVKEFDCINEERIKNSISNYNNEFQELITFVEEFVGSPDNVDAYQLMTIKKNREKGQYVQIKNYVGLIQLKSGFQIEILPKIYMAEDDDNKKIFLKMLKSMKDFDGKSFNISNLKVENMNLYEIFINLYLQETDRLVKHGLKSSYITNEENLNVVKGKLLFKEQVKKNNVHKEKFYVQYDEYQLNMPENKLVKSTLTKLLNVTEIPSNKKLCRQLLSHFENVDLSTNYEYDFSKIKIDRNTKDYEMLMKWSKVFLNNKSFSTFSGDSQSRAILFQMDKLFESYIGKIFKDLYSDKDVLVSTQDRGFYLFDKPEPEFALRPDIIVERNNKVIILDTKWKDLVNEPNKNYGISQSDMYQMYAYSKKYGKGIYNPEVYLIYPLNTEFKKDTLIDYKDNDGVKVHVRFVDLTDAEESIRNWNIL